MKIQEKNKRNSDMLMLYETGLYTIADLARKYNLSWKQTERILKGQKKYQYKDPYLKTSLDALLERIETGDRSVPRIIWTSKHWGTGPPLGIRDKMIGYQDQRYNGSFYDEDEFWKYTV